MHRVWCGVGPLRIDLTSPDAPQQLATRAGTLLVALEELGVRPMADPIDLMLISLLPLAIKKILTGNPFIDAKLLKELIDKLDLSLLQSLIRGDEQ